ncbi:MAG: 16S rRNA (guanine(527)-N(7))-methyltransferase RsmG [Candidatus Cardinium sp.]|uniref:16S rRNA (guanine(527)-N(7))-methyltransferase RsmG n=1 Tax=Cardinium endosymbiont of Dermatophagoides farinae TaxID=2597823 RepID=UPI0011826A4A|nr:16S rRNA (guanine(527)-N(7))-methyltransferase RsmG [Cardinium endosymbiont of Dermatophagoides farinae]TSJ80893.1 16S rRNA (guanine(527)-N(7))-methyltransferase RsmG [Cardinium endosymbiont of Dermatophagoides farinae]UWW96905.1 MAG: 16S rRNA (guanine(527)-N(7))-methyltransferase RsmG [Candidatus Cardinium sp.]
MKSIISHYFPELSPAQIELFNRLGAIYAHWNATINLISRKDIDHLYLHHVLHSLAIAKATTFSAHTKILDFGTGGGFPGIPLAIIFPAVDFHLIDATAKKIKAVEAIVATLGLDNVTVAWGRGEALKTQYDFIVGRGVTNLTVLYSWVKDKIALESKNSLSNGILYLKGAPFEPLPCAIDLYPLQRYFTEAFFKEKYLVHAYGI